MRNDLSYHTYIMKTKLKMRLWLASCLLTGAWLGLQAQTDGLRLRYDFEQTSGASVSDVSPEGGVTATLKNQAQVVEMGKYHVLDLGSGTGYLDLTARAGEVFRSLDSYTVSVYYRVDEDASLSGNGFFLWAFSTSEACTASDGKYSAYRLNAQRFANSTGGYGNEYGIEVGGASEKGRWIHVLYTQDGARGSLYLDGVRKGTSGSMPLNSVNFAGADVPYVWLGRAPFSADSYLTQTLIYDFRLYDRVLDAAEIEALAALTDSLDYEYRYGNTGDFSALRAAVEAARRLVAEDASDFPAAAVGIFEDVINVSQDLIDEGKVNQSIIDAQLAELTAAQATLEATRGWELDDSGTAAGGYDTERGFRHPGALHTDADFARIRAQIAAGNEEVVAAYNVLLNAEYSQSTVTTYPVETIVRGGGVGENYINAARGATMAYQNALRWKIDGTKANADRAVQILNAWANTTKVIGGDSNYALAAGLYGYEFANAAELMRDYEGWAEADFENFKRWMLDVWYPSCINFLRGRNGTWENAANIPAAGWGAAGQRPGHYWSNWGLCNALAVMTIGILCDDVFIYNQGLSYYKYDQVGTFTNDRGSEITNDGLTEFLGNLVPVVHADERVAYGYLGQMQESGRDQGHAAMALGLAVDICQTAWNQGDDLFSYMDNRLAAGIEFFAAYNHGGVAATDLPWTTYCYADCRTAWHNAWRQTGISGAPHAARPYWGRIIGHYEGIKGVALPYAEMAKKQMGIDGGGTGGTSGGYDHMGYSVLTCTRDSIGPDQAPTLLTPVMEYNGLTVEHNELGGLSNTFEVTPTSALPAGTIVTLKPQLPEGVADDAGQWAWTTGETTKDITVVADASRVYRVTYTNANGVKSEQVFTIAVASDCEESKLTPHITYNGETFDQTSLEVLYGSSVTLSLDGGGGWGQWSWENGSTASSITLPHVTSGHTISVVYTNQGGRKHLVTFQISVRNVRPDITVGNRTYQDSTVAVVDVGTDVVLTAVSTSSRPGTYLWSDGSTGSSLTLEDVQASGTYTVDYTVGEDVTSLTFYVYVPLSRYATPESGNYYIRYENSDTYLTNRGDGSAPVFMPKDESNPLSQQWGVENTPPLTIYSFISLLDSTYLTNTGELKTSLAIPFRFSAAVGTDRLAILKSATSGLRYWGVRADGSINFAASELPNDFPFELIPVEGGTGTGLDAPAVGERAVRSVRYYTESGIRLDRPRKGLNIRQTLYTDGTVETDKFFEE